MSRFTSRAFAALLASCVGLSALADDADSHLKSGAAHFRAGRFAQAVVEFKVARELGAGDEGLWYVAAALTRAGRHVDALEAFAQAAELAPRAADALFLYYRGVACAEQQLMVCASSSFELAARSAGPKVAEQARQLAAEAAALLVAEPPRAAIDELLRRAGEATHARRPRLASAYAQEAAALSARRADRWRLDGGTP